MSQLTPTPSLSPFRAIVYLAQYHERKLPPSTRGDIDSFLRSVAAAGDGSAVVPWQIAQRQGLPRPPVSPRELSQLPPKISLREALLSSLSRNPVTLASAHLQDTVACVATLRWVCNRLVFESQPHDVALALKSLFDLQKVLGAGFMRDLGLASSSTLDEFEEKTRGVTHSIGDIVMKLAHWFGHAVNRTRFEAYCAQVENAERIFAVAIEAFHAGEDTPLELRPSTQPKIGPRAHRDLYVTVLPALLQRLQELGIS